jgi:hypothetical protein
VVSIPAGADVGMLRPLPRFPARKDEDPLSQDALPHDLLLLDIAAAAGGPALAGRQLFCRARLEGAGVDGAPPPAAAAPARTRAVAASARGEAVWRERLVAALPSRPAERHTIVWEVWDAAAAGGAGALLGAARLAVTVGAIPRKEEGAPLEVEVSVVSGADGAAVCTLRASYMRQRQWRRGGGAAAAEPDAWGAERSTAGLRALSLASKEGCWVVVPGFGQQRAAAGTKSEAAAAGVAPPAGVASVTPLRMGEESVVLEGRVEAGEWREQLRALCQLVNATEFTLEAALAGAEGGGAQAGAPPRLVLLGRAPPGAALPLPLGWQRAGRELLIRPVVAAAPAAAAGTDDEDEDGGGGGGGAGRAPVAAAHGWGAGASGGAHSVRLDSLEEGATRLVACPPLTPDPAAQGAPGDRLTASTLWFSLAVECDVLAGGQRAEAELDWRVVAAPPLTLVSQLPMSGSLMVWEAPGGGPRAPQLVERQSQRVGAGASVAVHTADVRRALSFTLYPDGYDWAEAAPAGLSASGSGSGLALPDRFRVVRPGSRLPVEIFIQRAYELGPWGAAEGQGAAVARGVPLAVTLLAPLWVVNATGLAIDAAIVPVPPPPQVRHRRENQPPTLRTLSLARLHGARSFCWDIWRFHWARMRAICSHVWTAD